MDQNDTKERVIAAHKLFFEETTTRAKFESIRTLIKGIHPKIDSSLEACSNALTDLERLHKGDVIELSASHLPENTEEEKKRKRVLLLFIRSWKDLQSEIERVKIELSESTNGKTGTEQAIGVGRIIKSARGPFGIITIVAVVVVGVGIFVNSQSNKSPQQTQPTPQVSSPERETTKVIVFQGQKIPLSQLGARSGPDCDSEHYHAKNSVSVVSLEGKTILDPGACAFGKVSEIAVIEVAP